MPLCVDQHHSQTIQACSSGSQDQQCQLRQRGCYSFDARFAANRSVRFALYARAMNAMLTRLCVCSLNFAT